MSEKVRDKKEIRKGISHSEVYLAAKRRDNATKETAATKLRGSESECGDAVVREDGWRLVRKLDRREGWVTLFCFWFRDKPS